MGNKVRLLSTASLGNKIIDDAEGAGVMMDVIPFIKSSAIFTEGLGEEIKALCDEPLTVVFTSVNAIYALGANMQQGQPLWKIYCIGHATKSAALDYFKEEDIRGTGNDAAGLAQVIKEAQIKEVIFFCGDKRMDTLPLLLRNAGIEVKEIIVYTTEATPCEVSSAYDGILFFSPSAAESFFSVNSIPGDTVLFAIGSTTANVIKKHCDNYVWAGDNPSKELLVQESINYFHTKNYKKA